MFYCSVGALAKTQDVSVLLNMLQTILYTVGLTGYEALAYAYAVQGDVHAVTSIMTEMKSKGIFISKAGFNTDFHIVHII